MASLNKKNKITISICAVALVLIVALSILLPIYFCSFNYNVFMLRHRIELPEGFDNEEGKIFYGWTLEQLEEDPYEFFGNRGSLIDIVFAIRIQMGYLKDKNLEITERVRSDYELFEKLYTQQYEK